MVRRGTRHALDSRGVDLLVSILVRYPELTSINFDAGCGALKFTFLVAGVVGRKEFPDFRRRLLNSLEVLQALEGRTSSLRRVERGCYDDVTVIELTRDVDTLTQEEISLSIELLRETFGDRLVEDGTGESPHEEELDDQDELIGKMLDDVRGHRSSSSRSRLIAVREEGRVLVFNK